MSIVAVVFILVLAGSVSVVAAVLLLVLAGTVNVCWLMIESFMSIYRGDCTGCHGQLDFALSIKCFISMKSAKMHILYFIK